MFRTPVQFILAEANFRNLTTLASCLCVATGNNYISSNYLRKNYSRLHAKYNSSDTKHKQTIYLIASGLVYKYIGGPHPFHMAKHQMQTKILDSNHIGGIFRSVALRLHRLN
jgi:hypothetical protein